MTVKVPSKQQCTKSSALTISSDNAEGYIASSVTKSTGCGDASRPWMLTAGVGQRINITLIDFANSESSDRSDASYECVVYATIQDGDGGITHTVCGGGQKRVTPVFLSSSNAIEIRLVGKSIQKNNNEGQFLLKYTGKLEE